MHRNERRVQGNKVYIKFCYNLVVTEEHNKPEYALPDNVIDAIVNRKVVLFIGAGVSKQYGVPLWDELGNDMLKECFIRGKCSYKDYDRMLKRGYSALQKVTIAYNILGKDDSYAC